MLVIIDEFKSWQDLHPPGSQGFAEDEHVLETLAFHLPVDEHARIVTVVASQAPPPAKLMGGAQGDRFKLMSLFAGEHSAWEYDAIVADVVREVRYEGERVIVSGWSMVWGNRVVDKTNYTLHFRIVYLLDQAEMDPPTLHDDRIAVVIPGKWEETTRDSSRRYTALVKMQENIKASRGQRRRTSNASSTRNCIRRVATSSSPKNSSIGLDAS